MVSSLQRFMHLNVTSSTARVHAVDHARYLFNRLRDRCQSRWSVHRPSFTSELTLATAGFNGNLGDRALLQTTAALLNDLGWQSRGIAYDHAQRWRCNSTGILMAGGEIGDNRHFLAVMKMQPDPSRCAVVGISPTNAFLCAPDAGVLDYLCQVPYLAVRNQAGCQALQKLLDNFRSRGNGSKTLVSHIPDLVFAQAKAEMTKPKRMGGSSILGINITPLFLNFTASGQFESAADLAPLLALSSPGFDMDAATLGYVELIRELLRLVRAQGYKVVHLPFSAADAAFAAVVDPLLRPGTCRVPRQFSSMVRQISRCDVMLATRFHGHIAAMIARTPLICLGAAGKTIQLLQDLDCPPGWARERFREGGASAEELWSSQRVLLPSDQLKQLGKAAKSGVETAASALMAAG